MCDVTFYVLIQEAYLKKCTFSNTVSRKLCLLYAIFFISLSFASLFLSSKSTVDSRQ